MPYAPKRPCRYPGCPNLCEHGHTYCPIHDKTHGSDAIRGGAAFRGYDRRWQKARDDYLRKHPLCVKCQEEGRLTPATVVDHIIPHRGDRTLFWDVRNWQSLCKSCHDKKTGSGL